MTDPSPPPSDTVAGRYQIERRIARGGMADVYVALDTVLDRRVALKVLDDRQVGDAAHVARFEREARSAAGLNHPNIVAIYDSGVDDGHYYIAMEYVEGATLAQQLTASGPLSLTDGCRIAADIADALDFAHRHGLIHRDVKPSNILLGTDGRTRVTDFGIARALSGDEGLTEVGMAMGTPRYSSPEQAQGLPLDPRSDLYSLGVVLFEMLTGEPPFTGTTPVAVAQRHVNDAAPVASSLRPELPGDADQVIGSLLAKDPGTRYASAAELRADLHRLAAGEHIEHRVPVADPPALAPQPPDEALTAAMTPAADAGVDRTEAMPPWMQPDREPRRRAGDPVETGRRGFSLAVKVLVSLLAFSLLGLGAIVAWNQLDLSTGDESTGGDDEPTTTAPTPAAPAADSDQADPGEAEPDSAGRAVPTVTGELQADAERILADAGFTVSAEAVDVEADSPSVGRVVGQRPAAGDDAEPGSEVVLGVGRATQPATTTSTAAPSTTGTSTEAPTTAAPPTDPPTSPDETNVDG